jgi:predicted RNA-binding Zn ribbon-like protein
MMSAVDPDPANVERQAGVDFIFIGGRLAIDFVNTEIITRGRRRDLLATQEDIIRWWDSARAHHPDTDIVRVEDGLPIASPALHTEAKALRAALRQILSDVVVKRSLGEPQLAELNEALKLGYPALEQAGDGALNPVYRADTQRGAILLPIALSARRLLAQDNLARLHLCRNPRCILFFYDETRSATRHWCSLECMDRARSIQRYQAAKAERARQAAKHEM